MTSERAAAPWDRALEIGLCRAPVGARLPCGGRRDMNTLDGLGKVDPGVGRVVVSGQHSRARVRAMVWAGAVRSAAYSFVATTAGANATLVDIGGHTRRNRHGRRSKGPIRCGIQSSVLIRLRGSVVRHVVAPRATDVSTTSTVVAKRTYSLSLYGRSTEAAKHRVDRVLPKISATAEVQFGDTTTKRIWVDSGQINRRNGVALTMCRAWTDGRGKGRAPLAGWWITVAARARGVITEIGRPRGDRADRGARPTDVGEEVRVGHRGQRWHGRHLWLR